VQDDIARWHSWINNPAWTLFAQSQDDATLLLVSGGADALYVVDEAQGVDAIDRIVAAWQADALAPLVDDADCGAAVRQLVRLGVLVPPAALASPARIAFAWLGMPMPALESAFDAMSDAGGAIRVDADAASVQLVVRTDVSWSDALATYRDAMPAMPHLFVDVAYQRTLGVGPYVVPGDTACVYCLGNRVIRRWGDPPTPQRPSVASDAARVASLIAPLLRDATRLLPFLEHAVSLDLYTLASTRERVVRLPWCPACRPVTRTPSPLVLPWIDASTGAGAASPR
jgi:bacteriocin biosynthesis cyclodehydratase domain-containing protein